VTNGKWQIQVAVELIGPVVARVNCPFVTNCGEGGLRIHQSGGCWWVRNGKWQQSEYGIYCVMDEKWEVVMNIAVELDGPVVAGVSGTFVANCGEAGWLIYQSGGWWWVRIQWQW
jgi:hypothetical protein